MAVTPCERCLLPIEYNEHDDRPLPTHEPEDCIRALGDSNARLRLDFKALLATLENQAKDEASFESYGIVRTYREYQLRYGRVDELLELPPDEVVFPFNVEDAREEVPGEPKP